MITKENRKTLIEAASQYGWKTSFGGHADSIHFFRVNAEGYNDGGAYVDIYFNQAGDMITEAWTRQGMMEPDMQYILDYLQKRGHDA
jgi:hypothetical protein